MSRFADAGQLALTKLKTRRVRLSVTIIISSILFCLLLAAAFTVQGTVKSIEKFRSAGFGSRYIITAYPLGTSYDLLSDKKLIIKAQALQKDLVAKKKAEAKRLGIEYDPASEMPFVDEIDQGPFGKTKQLNTQIPQVFKLVQRAANKQPGGVKDFKEVSSRYNAKATYLSIGSIGGASFGGPPTQPYLSPLKNGKEDLSQSSGKNFGFGPGMNSIDTLSSQWQLFSEELLKPFVLQGQNLKVGDDGSIPIIAPYSGVEQVLGLKSLPATASSSQRLQRLKEVRSKAAGYLINVCYRNQSSNSQVQQTIQQRQEIKAGKAKKDYQLPDLIYGVPTKPCAPVRITRDKRASEQKTLDAKQEKFNRKFGEQAPYSKLLHLRIVGINSDIPTGGAVSVTQIFQSVLTSTLGTGWASPLELDSHKSVLAKIFGVDNSDDSNGQGLYAEFNSSAQVEKILKEQNCEPIFGPQTGPNFNPFKKCLDEGKYFGMSPFGSSSVALDHFKKGFDRAFWIAGLIISGIAAVILMGTVGRIIADSRRETAVFRAIGAKRRDIAQIYIIYVVSVALLIAATSTVFGYLISQLINSHYSSSVTVDALVAFNVSDLNQKFSMTSFYLKDILYVAGLVIAAALLASSLPLLTNLRRNPIKDMRDER